MSDTISIKDSGTLKKKNILNLLLIIIIAFLGISSLIIKFFVYDGVIAFRAFTVDGNLFTTIVMSASVIHKIIELILRKETKSNCLYFLKLASAVTEAVIFIVVMIGYLPFFEDDPAITPYHMFCLHVAIPVLTVLNFIFFERPIGRIPPAKMLLGAIPILVYGVGVITAIKTGLLPARLVPYSFLDFNTHFLWYLLFALVCIMSFGYFWAWLFYRGNLKMSRLWYSGEDLEQVEMEIAESKSRYEVVNSQLILMFCAFALFLLMMSLMLTANTTTKVQNDLIDDLAWDNIIITNASFGEGDLHERDNALYKGETRIGDGTAEGADTGLLSTQKGAKYYFSIYMRSANAAPDVQMYGTPSEFVCINGNFPSEDGRFGIGKYLEQNIIDSIYENHFEYSYDDKIDGEKYSVYYTIPFNKDINNYLAITDEDIKSDEKDHLAVYAFFVPTEVIVNQGKTHEVGADVIMAVVISAVFAILFIITSRWSRSLQKCVDYLKRVADDDAPDEPLTFGNKTRMSGLADSINAIAASKRSKK